jgi:hypothetical protein
VTQEAPSTEPLAESRAVQRVLRVDQSNVARQSGWERGDDQEGHFDGRGEMMIVAARR